MTAKIVHIFVNAKKKKKTHTKHNECETAAWGGLPSFWQVKIQGSPLERSLFLSLVQAVINTMCGFGVQTQNYLEANKSIYPVGCADRAVMWIESHLLLVGALALGLALPQVNPDMHLN